MDGPTAAGAVLRQARAVRAYSAAAVALSGSRRRPKQASVAPMTKRTAACHEQLDVRIADDLIARQRHDDAGQENENPARHGERMVSVE